jgi:chemotaxis protein MotB
MTEPHPEVIIVKRRNGHEEGHHGGAWKIAFADFMTAMMAFFLVLWIINATDKNTKTIIARYFNPVKLEDAAKAAKGIHGADLSQAQVESSDPAATGETADAKPGKETAKAADAPARKSEDARKAPQAGAAEPADPARPQPTMPETALFSDPYASLDTIARAPPPAGIAEAPNPGVAGAPADPSPVSVEGFRDPFKPVGPSTVPDTVATSDPAPMAPPGAGARKDSTEGAAATPADAPPGPPEPASAAAPAARVPTPPRPRAAPPPTTAASNVAQLRDELRRRIADGGASSPGPAIDVEETDEGLLISLTDRMNFSMFAVGSAEPQAKVIETLNVIARSLRDHPGALIVRGHTDARPYKSPTYDNWRLSSARAQMTYYMLTRAGLPEKRFERIEGYSDRRLKDASHPLAEENRRIEILVREARP